MLTLTDEDTNASQGNNEQLRERTPHRTASDNGSHPSTTPRSVLSDPDESEIETANTLLSLGSLESIDRAVDNESILLVNKPCTEDFTRDLAAQEQAQEPTKQDEDSDKTVDYGNPPSPDTRLEEESSLKGVMRYKHYGIKRRSPSTTTV